VKYTNHINIILAIVGIAVVVQTLTGTFWNSAPEQEFSVDMQAVRPRVVSPTPRSATPTSRRASIPAPGSVTQTPSTAASTPHMSPSVNRPFTAGSAAPQTAAPQVADPEAADSSPNVVTIGEPTSPSGVSPSEPAQRQLRGPGLFGSRSTRGSRESRTPVYPPPVAGDAVKRSPSTDAPVPPVRSSMPEQRP